jgi:hypothetical protein
MTQWQWYYSQCEERWSGPCRTRDGAIAEGLNEYSGEPFIICEARRSELCTDVTAYRLLEMLDELNEEFVDGDGDGRAFPCSGYQERQLEKMVSQTIKHWCYLNKISLIGWAFAEQRNEERIDIDAPGYGEAHRIYYDQRLADMGRHALWNWWEPWFSGKKVGLRTSYPLTLGVADRRNPILPL